MPEACAKAINMWWPVLLTSSSFFFSSLSPATRLDSHMSGGEVAKMGAAEGNTHKKSLPHFKLFLSSPPSRAIPYT